ncbi:hypothetical protein H072_5460 [Dactylellina haptotyla CBS 200.50]|uniref:Uncharacterized protein n=1 Tax=Dactylellina haptotyla (strain CBS 200.50) TaxID=1284197 RepID=S8BZ72_DACHA|nr:hypothetical protein H072_5460 [Dactylellina haptotyla CBS 200.50]
MAPRVSKATQSRKKSGPKSKASAKSEPKPKIPRSKNNSKVEKSKKKPPSKKRQPKNVLESKCSENQQREPDWAAFATKFKQYSQDEISKLYSSDKRTARVAIEDCLNNPPLKTTLDANMIPIVETEKRIVTDENGCKLAIEELSPLSKAWVRQLIGPGTIVLVAKQYRP